MFRVDQHLVSRGELHVPSVSVELRLAPFLPQPPHLSRHAALKSRSGLAEPGGGGRVLASRRGKRAAGVLSESPNSVEGRVAGA